jgi:hypothetical protein
VLNHFPGERLAHRPEKSRGFLPLVVLKTIEVNDITSVTLSEDFFEGY